MPAWIDKMLGRQQDRSLWARTDGDLLRNDPSQLVWLGSDQWPGVLASYGTAEALPVVNRATALITGPLTAATFRVQQGGAGAPLPAPRWISDPMLLRADDRFGAAHPAARRLSRSEFWTGLVRSALWWGWGAFVFQPDAAGEPIAGTLRLVDPRLLSVDSARWVLGTGPDRAEFDRDGYLQLGPQSYRIAVLRNPHSPVAEDGTSKGVFDMSPGAFGLAAQVDSYASGTFKSGVPAGYLKVGVNGLTQPQADELKASWMSAHGGDRRSIAVLNSTTDFTPVSMTPVDAELASVKRLAIADVAFAFSLDPGTLGASLNNSATYQNIRDAWQNHRDFGLSPWISSVQDLLGSLLPSGRTVTVALDQFANPPATERYAAYTQALQSKWLTVDEVRALEGLPPMEEGESDDPTPSTPPEAPQPDPGAPGDPAGGPGAEEGDG